MKLKLIGIITIAALSFAGLGTAVLSAQKQNDEQLLQVREAVWRAWFANDTKTLQALVPTDTIVISDSEKNWKHQTEVFQSAADFRSAGGKLVCLEFPRTGWHTDSTR